MYIWENCDIERESSETDSDDFCSGFWSIKSESLILLLKPAMVNINIYKYIHIIF